MTCKFSNSTGQFVCNVLEKHEKNKDFKFVKFDIWLYLLTKTYKIMKEFKQLQYEGAQNFIGPSFKDIKASFWVILQHYC